MTDIDRYRHDDRVALEALHRRGVGDESARALGSRWEWFYERNPNRPDGTPLIWLSREAGAITGQYATMPVRLVVDGIEIDAAWGTDVMVSPEHRGKGVGEALFAAWGSGVGAAIGLGLTDASHGLFKKMKWPYIGQLSRFAKPMSFRGLADWQAPPHPLVARATMHWRRLSAPMHRLAGAIRLVRDFDEGFTRLWERVAPRFAFAVRRDAAYLQWKYLERPGAEYVIAALERGGETAGYVVCRHSQEGNRQVTTLVDFLADPADRSAMSTLLRWVDRQAVEAGSDILRTFASHAAFQRSLREAGYGLRSKGVRLVVKINAVGVSPGYYDSTAGWHITWGDSDCERPGP